MKINPTLGKRRGGSTDGRTLASGGRRRMNTLVEQIKSQEVHHRYLRKLTTERCKNGEGKMGDHRRPPTESYWRRGS